MFNKITLQQAADILIRKNHSLALAESVTAGLLQAAFANADNATAFFQGGITAYNAKQKYTHFHIDLLQAVSCNCVSAMVASEMALGVSKSFASDWGIGVTGYASPLPHHKKNPLYAHYAISFRNEIVKHGKLTAEVQVPLQVQVNYVNDILRAFSNLLEFGEKK